MDKDPTEIILLDTILGIMLIIGIVCLFLLLLPIALVEFIVSNLKKLLMFIGTFLLVFPLIILFSTIFVIYIICQYIVTAVQNVITAGKNLLK